MEIKRGDIYYADLSPVMGSEQGGIRPVLIIQNDKGNQYSPTVIAAAITGRKKRWMPTHVQLYHQTGLNRSSCIMLEQVRTIDRTRLVRYIGRLDDRTMAAVDTALAVSLGMERNSHCPEKHKRGRCRRRDKPKGQAGNVTTQFSAKMMQEVDTAIAVSFGLDKILFPDDEKKASGASTQN